MLCDMTRPREDARTEGRAGTEKTERAAGPAEGKPVGLDLALEGTEPKIEMGERRGTLGSCDIGVFGVVATGPGV